jgi:deoxyribose-phosphate aldolase
LKNFENSLKVCSVVGFPLGASSTQTKLFEAKNAIVDGADEIDVVINIGKAKEGNFAFVKDELSKIKKQAKRHIVKAIIETCYFDENDIIKLCKVCMQAKVDFVKTSTGFGTAGATEQNVSLIKKIVAGQCLVKASGRIRTREQAINLINLGADRIGTSHIL